MKATTFLQRQHRDLQQLLETVEWGSTNVRASLLPQLAGDLVAHIEVESQIFYPAASAALVNEDASILSGRTRHAQAMQSLDRALDAPLDGDEFRRAIQELETVVNLHATEEDEGIFLRLERKLDAAALHDLGQSMMSFYHSKVEAGYARLSEPPPPFSR